VLAVWAEHLTKVDGLSEVLRGRESVEDRSAGFLKDGDQDLGECFAYSDSYSDVPLLSVVGHPCVVNPDLRLSKLARTYAWPVIHLGKQPAMAALLEKIP